MDIIARSEGELCEKLRLITLRGTSIQPYLNSYISIETIHPRNLAPTQRYVLDYEIKKIEQIRWDIIADWGFDILSLNGYLKVTYPAPTVGLDDGSRVKGNPSTIDIIPPVIEEYVNPTGNIDLIINDGQHRCYLAYLMNTPLRVAYVRGRHPGYPYYAYPLPNGWNDVELRSAIPEGYIKKFHVAKDHKSLYRNFNSQFDKIGDSRPYTKSE